MEINSLFQWRHGTLAEWESSTYIPRVGEPCYATDAKILKVGDGTNRWSGLLAFINESVEAEAETLAPGSAATASFDVSDGKGKFHFGIPKGKSITSVEVVSHYQGNGGGHGGEDIIIPEL